MSAVKQVVVHHTLKVTVHRSSAASQYPPKPPKPPKPHVKPQQTFKPPPKAAAVTASPSSSSAGTLPFTGLSLFGTLVVSLGLVGLGLLMRRRERKT